MRLNRSLILLTRVLLLCLAGSAARAGVLVTLSTSSVSLSSGGSATLTALVTGATTGSCTAAPNPAICNVTWSSSPQVGSLGAGNTASANGTSVNNYAAPALISQRQTITITATSVADPSQSASVQIQLNPAAVTVSPATATLSPGGALHGKLRRAPLSQ